MTITDNKHVAAVLDAYPDAKVETHGGDWNVHITIEGTTFSFIPYYLQVWSWDSNGDHTEAPIDCPDLLTYVKEMLA